VGIGAAVGAVIVGDDVGAWVGAGVGGEVGAGVGGNSQQVGRHASTKLDALNESVFEKEEYKHVG